MKLHFIHGWAFDASIWQSLSALMSGAQATYADRGYFGGIGDFAPQDASVWITHSFGTMLALGGIPAHCHGVVIINGFDRFRESEGVAGIAPRVLDRMVSRFDDAPQQVAADFRQGCGCDEPIQQINPESLRADLVALRDMDCRAQSADLSIPVLSLQGGADPILPRDMRAQTLHSLAHARHLQHPTAGHLLPLEQPQWCAAQICAFLEDIC